MPTKVAVKIKTEKSTMQELATWQGCEVPTEDEDVRELIKIVLKELPEKDWDSKFSPATCAHLALCVKARKSKRAVPVPADYKEKKIAPDHAPVIAPKDADIPGEDVEIIPHDFECTEERKTFEVGYLLDKMEKGELPMPEIQRNEIWPVPKKCLLLDSIFSPVPIDAIALFREKTDTFSHVGDGLQRLTALKEFKQDLIRFGDSKKGLLYSQLSPKMQAKFNSRSLKIDEITCAREYWPLIFRLKNMGGIPLNEYEGRRAFYITKSPYVKMLDDLTNPVKSTGAVFCELFGGNNRFKGHGAIMRAMALSENAENYCKPMKTFLDKFCAEKMSSAPTADQVEELRDRLDLIVQALKEKLGSDSFRFKNSRTNNLGLVDAMIYGGLLFQEAGIDSIDTLGPALVELRKRVMNSDIVKTNLKDDTSKNESVVQRMAAVQLRADRIIKKVAE